MTPEPISVALTWLNFPLSVLMSIQGAVASVTNVYYDMDINILKSLFLENDGHDYFNYANNRLFQTLDVAKFTTVADVQMQDAALQYVADQSSLVLATVSNQAEWLAAFRTAMDTQLTALDATAMGYDMGLGSPSFRILDPGIPMSRPATADEVVIAGATFTSKPFAEGDIVYLDVACTFANSTKTYRVNLRAAKTLVQEYPAKYLPPPSLSTVHVYVCHPESVLTTSTWTVNDTSYFYPFVRVGALSGVNIVVQHGFYVIFSSTPLTIGSGVPAGVAMTGDAAVFYWLVSITSVPTVPTLTGTIRTANNNYISTTISNYASLTTQGKIFLSSSIKYTLVDDRIHDSGAAYTALGLTRQQPYTAQQHAYFQCARPEVEPLNGFYFIIPMLTVPQFNSFTVTITTKTTTTPYTLPDIAAGVYKNIRKFGNKVYLIADGVLFDQVTGYSLSDSSVVVKSCVIYRNLHGVVAPLPVTIGASYSNTYSNPDFLLNFPLLFSGVESPFQLTADRIKTGINSKEFDFYCDIITKTNSGITYPFLQIDHPTAFTVGVWADAGFHEERTSTQWSTEDVRVRLIVDGNGGTGAYSQILNIGNSVTNVDTGSITKGNESIIGFNTLADGTGDSFGSFVITQNTTYYAQWGIRFHVTYQTNGTDATGSQTDSINYAENDTVTVKSKGTILNGENSFYGWNTASDGSGISFEPGATFQIVSNMTFYAVWTNLFRVTYNNDPNGNIVNVYSDFILSGDQVTFAGVGAMTNSVVDKFTGQSVNLPFKCWKNENTIYYPGDTLVMTANVSVVACYGVLSITYETTAGSGAQDDATRYVSGETVLIKNQGTMENSSLTFDGWQFGMVTYQANDPFIITNDVVLTARWN